MTGGALTHATGRDRHRHIQFGVGNRRVVSTLLQGFSRCGNVWSSITPRPIHTCDEVAARGIRLIANPENAGFAAAVNQGVRATTAPLILSLNPDARLVTWPRAHGRAVWNNPETGAVGGMLIGETATPERFHGTEICPLRRLLVFEVLGINRLWPGNPVNWHYRCLGIDPMSCGAGSISQPARS